MKPLICWLTVAALFAVTLNAVPREVMAGTPAVQSTVSVAIPDVEKEEQQILADLEFLASDALEGRDTGSPGIREAADYIRQVFAESGWKTPETFPEGLQPFTIPGLPKLGPENSLASRFQGEEQVWELNVDFAAGSFGGSGKFSGSVVFCGYGIADPENGYDDFAGVDLAGKVALILRRVPGQSRPGSLYVKANGNIDAEKGALRRKILNARERGAVAVLFVNDFFPTVVQGKKDDLMKFGYGGAGDNKLLPALHITQNVAGQLLRQGLGISLKDWYQESEKSLQPASAVLKEVVVSGQVDLDFNQIVGQNVIAVLEPADPETKETIILGAHYDHVGWGQYGSLAPGTHAIHNGADDNASGTAALLAIARRFAGLSGKLPRRVVLIAFAAEERGLLGSKHYVSEPLYPLEETIAMLNLDMVGRMSDEKLTVFGVGSSSVWNNWLDRLAEETDLSFFREKKAFGPSDHASFYEKQIPVLHLFTGLHEDYHRPTDDVPDINLQGIRQVVDVLTGLTLELVQSDKRPDYIENSSWIRVGNHAGGRPHVGISPDLSHIKTGYLVGQIKKNSPAAHAGLETGDLITAVNEKKISNRHSFWKVVDAVVPGEILKLDVERGSETFRTELKLGKPR